MASSDSKKTSSETAKLTASRKKSPFLHAKVMGSAAEMSQSAMGITLQGSSSKMTSTPAVMTSNFPTFDASAIAADASYMPSLKQPLVTGARRKLPFKAANRIKAQNTSILPRTAMTGKLKLKIQKDSDLVTDEELDVLYCQYVQALYLESRAKKSLDLRTKDSLDKLHKLWTVNQILMEKDKFLKKQLDSVMYMKQLIAFCENQKAMLKLVTSLIPNVINQYGEIADAVETIRHKLPAPAIALPADADQEKELLESVQQYEEMMRIFFENLPPDYNKLSEVGGFLHKLVQLKETMEREINRCTMLISAADQLATTESSLRIGEIQVSKGQLH